MKTIWITYSWADDEYEDVQFIAQELEKIGLIVKLDKWSLQAGYRLWDQIDEYISDPKQSDAWIFIATTNSLSSEPCKEEYAYALDRALNARGKNFPIIALLPSSVSRDLIPAGIRTRLYVSLKDSNWKERIISSVENREPKIINRSIPPFHLKVHNLEEPAGRRVAIEVRPRAGTWSPFYAAVPVDKNRRGDPCITYGPSNNPISVAVLFNCGKGIKEQEDGEWLVMYAQNEASPTQSYYILLSELPTKISFGVYPDGPGWDYTFKAN